MLCKIDFNDVQSCPNREYKWIGHYKEHFSKLWHKNRSVGLKL